MIRLAASLFASLLLTGQALATFEIKDPAAEIYENTPEKTAEYLGQKTCVDFLRDGAKDTDQYKADLVRVRDYVLDAGIDARVLPEEARLREFCIDHPKTSLREATDVLVGGSP